MVADELIAHTALVSHQRFPEKQIKAKYERKTSRPGQCYVYAPNRSEYINRTRRIVSQIKISLTEVSSHEDLHESQARTHGMEYCKASCRSTRGKKYIVYSLKLTKSFPDPILLYTKVPDHRFYIFKWPTSEYPQLLTWQNNFPNRFYTLQATIHSRTRLKLTFHAARPEPSPVLAIILLLIISYTSIKIAENKKCVNNAFLKVFNIKIMQ